MQRTSDYLASVEALSWLRSQLSWEIRLQELRDQAEGSDELTARRAA
jgi:hypothetical protein